MPVFHTVIQRSKRCVRTTAYVRTIFRSVRIKIQTCAYVVAKPHSTTIPVEWVVGGDCVVWRQFTFNIAVNVSCHNGLSIVSKQISKYYVHHVILNGRDRPLNNLHKRSCNQSSLTPYC